MTGTASLEAIGAAGAEALRRGDHQRAASLFAQLAAAAPGDRRAHLGLAMARRALGDRSGAHEAADAALKLNSRDLPALMLKGDLYAEQGDKTAAASFYGIVCKFGEAPNLPPEAVPEIRRAEAYCRARSAELLQSLQAALAAAGYDESRSSRRFAESVRILSGTGRRYVEEPLSFYFAGLPAIGFYERKEFPWIAALESQTEIIAEEFRAAAQCEDCFVPYVRAGRDRPIEYERKLLNSKDWSALFLVDDGVPHERNAARFPRTLAALKRTPLYEVPQRGPIILFSRLAPGTHIEAHTGFLNARLICHLPIIAPANCALRVGNETREWRRGEALLFNDTIEHEAWNRSDRDRVVLLFSVWRPELTEEERNLVSALMIAGFGAARGG
jgi:aspartyl/asparaginyl beta-hydroxylase (cupin superfamily)